MAWRHDERLCNYRIQMFKVRRQYASIRRLGWKTLLAAFAAILLIVIPCVVELSAGPPGDVIIPAPEASRTYRVFVADWGYHASIILEQPAGWRLGPPPREDAPFVEYAWGDRRFYMEGNHKPHALFAALFLPTASVTYIEAWNRAPNASSPAKRLLVRAVTADELHRLLISLEGTIRRDTSGQRAPPYPPARGYSGRFYASPEAYLWTRDCNRWVVDRLTPAGLARRGRGVLFSGQVPNHLVGFTEAQ